MSALFNKNDLRMLLNVFTLNMKDRFLGSRFGIIWAIANPVIMLSVFTFVFGFVFKSKIPGSETSLSYVIWLISGYGPWLAMTEGIMASTQSIIVNVGLVKNVIFKLEILPLAGVLMGIVPLLISIIFLAVLLAIDGKSPSYEWLILPYIMVLQFLFIGGLGLFLSALNVFVRDTSMVLPNLLLIVLFSSPIFFPIEAFPGVVRSISQFNPFYIIAEGYRQPLLYNHIPPLWSLVYMMLLSVVTMYAGLQFFGRLKNHFNSRL